MAPGPGGAPTVVNRIAAGNHGSISLALSVPCTLALVHQGQNCRFKSVVRHKKLPMLCGQTIKVCLCFSWTPQLGTEAAGTQAPFAVFICHPMTHARARAHTHTYLGGVHKAESWILSSKSSSWTIDQHCPSAQSTHRVHTELVKFGASSQYLHSVNHMSTISHANKKPKGKS
eukprot:1142688-Pelagomonas_calceolata.AAC.1